MKILIADDHPFTLQGTKSFVESYGYTVQDTSSNGISALNLITLHRPEIAILDINMPGLDGLDVAKKIQELKLKTKVILLTMHKELTIFKKANEYGIYGYILKEHAQTELEKCLQEVTKGNKYISEFLEEDLIVNTKSNFGELADLSLSERKILELVAQQKTSKQIAEVLFLSEKTVEGHRSKIIEKLGLPKEKNILLKWAMQQNL
ncbi:response regulator transcription factor [Flavobacterium difficile]|uniref:Response regulator transcription factor n=1 Tax=Flavobacterium difficile TaxID=2709659 RepID=A0ABX0I4H0_9FLAO|nr:response regulator transcription factor [Flavobacterium difficile]NHM01729.1 response regulator transcription factor [Flavobacterium difficile]